MIDYFEVSDGELRGIDASVDSWQASDGFYETMRLENGQIYLVDYHALRVKQSLRFFDMNEERLDSFILGINLLARQFPNGIYTLRVGFSTLRKFQPLFEIQPFEPVAEEIELIHFEFKDAIYPGKTYKFLDRSWMDPALSLVADETKIECLLFNQGGNLVESNNSNVFILSHGTIFTPAISTGCIDGSMRKYLKKNVSRYGLEFEEKANIDLNMITQADEIWLSNALRFLKFAKTFNGIKFGTEKGREVLRNLLEVSAGLQSKVH